MGSFKDQQSKWKIHVYLNNDQFVSGCRDKRKVIENIENKTKVNIFLKEVLISLLLLRDHISFPASLKLKLHGSII